ncbi:TetR/AcrR family transcriptional regulator [Evansella sp. AB-P1]|uniref:TetR/AcrR family transcriptional regulator n=1 Tax=Evansella sp. AB-P1 TaxID=3037653 RepID=UPI00241F6404|nr:TetR/AcrR family transcriptional regulator [Evansella sp. AB-P1]MDG5788813.1 TetR/AcrR family transcriptional regulator [Evansella sp. AB-P1]
MLREERKKELKKDIFLKSIELFKEYGYENVSVEKIASACGIAKGTFFNYFPKKEHVLLHLGSSQIVLVKEIIQTHQCSNIKSKVHHIFRELLATYSQHADLLKLTISETIRSALKAESANILTLTDTLTDMFIDAKNTGLFQSAFDPKTISSVLVGIYFNSLITWSLSESPDEDLEIIFNSQFEVVWEGIEKK